MTIKQLMTQRKGQKVHDLNGWVVYNRGNNNVRFIALNDGSTFDTLQVVLKDKLAQQFDKVPVGSAVSFSGTVVVTAEAKQPIELQANEGEVLKVVDEDYPIQRQEIGLETLREIPHLRHHTLLFRAVMRVRSTLLQEIHAWFSENNYLNAAAPIITSVDGEGAGETFTIDDSKLKFFDKPATLGVTGQLHAEALANGFNKVYTFAPTFRAEKSHTTRHAAEFWMIEPEMAFTNQLEAIKVAEDLLKSAIRNTMHKLKPEFDFLDNALIKDKKPSLIKKLEHFLSTGVKTLDYKDAIEELRKVKSRFEVQNIHFGIDLATEHERYLAEQLIKGPVAVTNYPKEIKAFYMKQNPDNKTVACFDILVPGVGELVGGSQRETDVEKLIKRIHDLKIDLKSLQWYVDLRRFGQFESSGFGIGFERLVMYVTGIENIRDVIPFPRTTGMLLM